MKYLNLMKSVILLLAFSLVVVACDSNTEGESGNSTDSTVTNALPAVEVLPPADTAIDVPADNNTDVPTEPNTENDPPETTKPDPKITPSKGNDKAGDKLSGDAVAEYSAMKEGCYLKVSFYSKGAGIDGKTQAKFDDWIKSYQKKYTVQLSHSTKPWGREGEIDYCFKMTNMKVKQRNAFINAAKKQVGGKELVRIEAALK